VILDVRARRLCSAYWVGGAQGLLNNFFALVEEAGAQLVVPSMGDDTVDAVGGAGFVGLCNYQLGGGAAACSLTWVIKSSFH
jgi:hypothetical protein